MQRKEENNSRWYHRNVLVGILILWRNSRLQLCALFCGFLLGGGNVNDPPFYLHIKPSLNSLSPFRPKFTSLSLFKELLKYLLPLRRFFGLFGEGTFSQILKHYSRWSCPRRGMGAKDGHLGRPEAPGDLTGGEKGALERRWESLWKTYQIIKCHLG